MDRTYLSSLLELWGLDESELECGTLLSATTSWARHTQAREADRTAEIATKTTAVAVGSVHVSQEERASCGIALGEEKPEEGRKKLANVTTEMKKEQLATPTDELEDKVCGLEEDSGNELKRLEGGRVLGQTLGRCKPEESQKNSVPGKVGVKGESLRGELTCPCCKHCNEIGMHWCSNCGTVLLPTLSNHAHCTSRIDLTFRHETESLSDYSGSVQLQPLFSSSCDVHVSRCSLHGCFDDQNQMPAQESAYDDVGEISSKQKPVTARSCRESGECSSPDKSTAQSRHMQETKGRYWSTSRTYHWRKPSSLKPAVFSPLGKVKQSTMRCNVVDQVSQEDRGNIRSTSVSSTHVPHFY